VFAKDSGLLQGTLELLVLKTLSWGPMHGYGIAELDRELHRRRAARRGGLALPGALPHDAEGVDPRRVGHLENNRKAKFYALHPRGGAAVPRAGVGVAAARGGRCRWPSARRARRRGRGEHAPLPEAPQAEVDAELAFHLEERVREYEARGVPPAEARARALERFGDVSGVRSECAELLAADRRAEARRSWLEDLGQDLRYGARAAVRAPVFSLLAIVTLALGIGANAAVFGVVKSVLLDALPYASADRVVRVYGKWASGTTDRGPLSVGTIRDVRERQRSFERMAVFEATAREAALVAGDDPRVVKVLWAEPELFRTLGVAAGRGRLLRDEDAQADTAYNVLLTHEAWQKHFGGDPGVIGAPARVRVNGIPRTVVGVLPRGFVGPRGGGRLLLPAARVAAGAGRPGARVRPPELRAGRPAAPTATVEAAAGRGRGHRRRDLAGSSRASTRASRWSGCRCATRWWATRARRCSC
jgi:hypothetical protein